MTWSGAFLWSILSPMSVYCFRQIRLAGSNMSLIFKERRIYSPPLRCRCISRFMRRSDFLNCSVGLRVQPTIHSEGSKAIGRLRRMIKSGGRPGQFGSDLWEVIAGIDGVAKDAFHELSMLAPAVISSFKIHCYGQQGP